jgi:outer membrane cobalamin receptor
VIIACCRLALLPARAAAAEAPALQSIVVTARRREESLQQVPAAVSVVDQALL